MSDFDSKLHDPSAAGRTAEVITVDRDSSDGVEISIHSKLRLPIVKPKQSKDALRFYLTRVRPTKGHTIYLEDQTSRNTPTVQTTLSVKPQLPIVSHRKERERNQQSVINVEEQSSRLNVQKYKNTLFNNPQIPSHSPNHQMHIEQHQSSQSQTIEISQTLQNNTGLFWNLAPQQRILRSKKLLPPAAVIDRQKQMQRQIKIIGNKNERNRQKTPSFNNYASAHGLPSKPKTPKQQSDQIAWNRHRQQQQQLRKIKQQKQERLRKEQEEHKLQQKRKRDRQQSAQVQQLLEGLMGMHPEKKIKTANSHNTEETLRKTEIVERINAEDQDDNQPITAEQCLSASGAHQKKQNRFGLSDIIKPYQSSAPHFLSCILAHDYQKPSSKPELKKIPDIFTEQNTYKKVFHYLITHECIAHVRHQLKTLEKRNYEAIKINIKNLRKNNEGMTQVHLQENGKQGVFQLKNLSLSKYRIGLVTSTKDYTRDKYGMSSQDNTFGFLVLLVTPQTKQDMAKEVRSLSAVNPLDLQWILRGRSSREAYYFDLQKLTTHVRQYLAVTNLPYSELSPAVLDPRILQREMSITVEHKELLDDVLGHLAKMFNQTQWQSIRDMVLRERGFVLLQGPPGTGKTSTLMGLLSAQYEYLRKTGNNRKIMICAPSNAAVDHIVKRIQCQGLFNGEGDIIHPSILRIGIVQTQDQDVRAVSLDELCERRILNLYSQSKTEQLTTPQIKQRIIHVQKQIRRLGQRRQDKDCDRLKSELTNLENMLFTFRKERVLSRRYYSQVESELLTHTQIILTTLSSAGNDKLDKIRGEIACLIIDEAAQATEPNLLIALQTGVQKVLLVGDPYQLPATCISSDANVTLFNRSLFERFLDAKIKPYFLNIQYRMAPLIRQFSSQRFYQNRLIDSKSVVNRKLPTYLRSFYGRNVVFLDVRFGEEHKRGDSHCNQAQARVIGLLIRSLFDPSVSLGVITPYQAQRKLILNDCQRQLQEKQQQRQSIEKNVMINTVDSFQGQQRDIMIVSTVRANQDRQVGFLADERRINVTLTRSKYLLVVVGHGDTLGTNEVWNSFLEWVEHKNCYYWANSFEDLATVIDKMFLKFNRAPVKRIKYTDMSSDIRKRHRKAIESNDFRAQRIAQKLHASHNIAEQRRETAPADPTHEQCYPNQSQVIVPSKQLISPQAGHYNLNAQQSQQIVEQKRLRQKQYLQFEEMNTRLRKLEQSNALAQNHDYLLHIFQ